MFVGRDEELVRLDRYLEDVRASGRGVFLGVRGRRQVGKSTLLEQFIERSGAPAIFFAASRAAAVDSELAEFVRVVAESGTAAGSLFTSVTVQEWAAALRLLSQAITEPTVVVLDELPWLCEGDPRLEGVLQTAWDRYLSRVPVLLVALGSDLSMMERLGAYDRPLYQRMRELVLEPLTVLDSDTMLQLSPEDSFDAQLVAGGFPRILQEWRTTESPMEFVQGQLADSTSPLVVIGERVLNAEFPATVQARAVLEAIGAGESTFTNISNRTGINEGSLSRALGVLVEDKRIVAAQRPLSGKASRLTRYVVADPYLRFWLRFVGPNLEMILRGRGEQVARRITAAWAEYRGRAVEPLVRAGIERILPDPRFGAAVHVGSYWTRTNDVEVDLVGADRAAAPAGVSFVGSITWREQGFTRDDLLRLAEGRARVPGADRSRLVAVARSRVTASGIDVAVTAEDLRAAWATAG